MRGEVARCRRGRFEILRGDRFFMARQNNLQGSLVRDKDARVAPPP
jgi:hypothetical protein